MNFTFTDLSNSIMNMVQKDLSGKITFDPESAGSEKQLFAEKLSKIVEKGKQTERDTSLETVPEKVREGSGELFNFLEQKLGKKEGISFLVELKKMFLALSKGELKNLSINEQGLETLKHLLAKAGFNSDELDELMAELTKDLEESKLGLDEVFDKLFEISVETEVDPEKKSEIFLGTSAMPFVESLLNALQIPREEIQEILAAAEGGEKGINLDVIIEKLQQVQKKAFVNHTIYQTRDDNENFKPLLKHLGIDPKPFQDNSLTLNDLVSAFEQIKNNLSAQKTNTDLMVQAQVQQKNSEDGKNSDLLASLFKGIEVKNIPGDEKNVSLLFDQIKKQVSMNQVLPVKEGAALHKAFDKLKSKAFAKGQETIKDGMAAMLDDQAEKMVVVKKGVEDVKAFSKQLKARSSALNDQPQVLVSDSKSSETQMNQAVLKAKGLPKNLPAFVTNQVSKSIVRAVNQGENTLRIHLKPPELGRLVMTIDNTGNTMKVNIVTENVAAREILVSNVNELKATLSNSGVSLERFEVDMSSDFRQSMADARHQAGNFNKRGNNKPGQGAEPANGDVINDPLNTENNVDETGSLHFVA